MTYYTPNTAFEHMGVEYVPGVEYPATEPMIRLRPDLFDKVTAKATDTDPPATKAATKKAAAAKKENT